MYKLKYIGNLMTMSLEISVKSGKFCCKEYKFLNQ